MTLAAELELPTFDHTAADLRGDHYRTAMSELEGHDGWLAAGPFGFIVLDREAGEFFLRTKAAVFPGLAIADIFQITEGPLREEIVKNIINVNGDDHRRLRNLVNPALSPRAVDRYRPVMRRFMQQLFDALPADGRTEFIGAFAKPYPSMVIAQVMGKKIVTVYLATLAAMSVIMGFALNAVFDIAGKSSLEGLVARHYHHHHIPVWQLVLSGIFLIVLLLSFYRLLAPRVQRLLGVKKTGREASGALVLSVSGMSCKNCARKVTEAVKKVSGVKEVEVDVKKGKVKVAGKVDINEVKKAVIDAGYKVA